MSSDYTAAILDELRAMNRKLATMGKISDTLARDFSALAERVQLAIGDTPAPDSIAFTVGEVITPAEPPVGSIVHDRDGDLWHHGPDGWGIRRTNGDASWFEVVEYGPLTVIEVGNGA